MSIGRTSNYGFPLPDFNTRTWHDQINEALRMVDALINESLQLPGVIGVWTISTAYTAGQRVVDDTTDVVWTCLVNHTSGSSTFSADRVAHPTYWVASTMTLTPRGAWAKNTAYAYYDIAYQTSEGVFAICTTAHTSSNGGADTIRTDAANWTFIADLGAGGGAAASAITYDDTLTSLGSTNVQDAIDDLYAAVVASLATKAPSASPTLTGTPVAPTATPGTNTTQIATTAFVTAAAAVVAATVTALSASLGALAYKATIDAAGLVADAILTYAKLASSAIATTAQFLANTASKLVDVATAWAALVPVDKGNITGTVTWDMATFINAKATLTGNVTLGSTSNTKKGQTGCIEMTQDGTGSRTLALNSTYWVSAGGAGITLSTAAGTKDLLFYQTLDNGKNLVTIVPAVA